METDIRCEILDTMLRNIKYWDNTIAAGIDIVQANQTELDRLMGLETEPGRASFTVLDNETYKNKLNVLIKEQNAFAKVLKNKQAMLLEKIAQLNNKDQVVSDYISRDKGAIFINRLL